MSSKKPTGGPAFPNKHGDQGMTLRDYFAAQALVHEWCKRLDEDDWSDTAEDAYRLADAMIAARDAL